MGTFANTANVFAQANDPGTDAGAGGIWSDTDAGLIYRRNDANDAWILIQTGTATHTLLDGSTHTDTAAQAVTQGSIIYGDGTPEWNELPIGAAGTALISDGTDIAYRTFISTRSAEDATFQQLAPTQNTWYATAASVTLPTRTNGRCIIVASARVVNDATHTFEFDILDDGAQTHTNAPSLNAGLTATFPTVSHTMALDGSTVAAGLRNTSGTNTINANDVLIEVIEVGS